MRRVKVSKSSATGRGGDTRQKLFLPAPAPASASSSSPSIPQLGCALISTATNAFVAAQLRVRFVVVDGSGALAGARARATNLRNANARLASHLPLATCVAFAQNLPVHNFTWRAPRQLLSTRTRRRLFVCVCARAISRNLRACYAIANLNLPKRRPKVRFTPKINRTHKRASKVRA